MNRLSRIMGRGKSSGSKSTISELKHASTKPDMVAVDQDRLNAILKEESENMLKNEEWFSESLTVIVFGASGDLAKKKTYPSLFALYCSQAYGPQTIICGYARSEVSDPDFRAKIKPFLMKTGASEHKDWTPEILEAKVDSFLKICIYRAGKYDSSSDLQKVSDELVKLHSEKAPGAVENRLFYFALPPDQFVNTAASVKAGGMAKGYNRLVIEKPFGHDTDSAKQLGKDLNAIFSEDYLYRIDHYLGKEMVQNLMVMRFGNNIFEPLWNRNYISSVLITFKEDIGTQGRGGYFDKSGIIRDVMQNHLMQVLSLVAMERPVRVAGEDYSNYVRDEKVKALRSMPPVDIKDVVLGQYTGSIEKGEPGYLEDPTVPKGSKCPTFACCVLHINNSRWEGVPFIMKAGKALDMKRTEIRIQFRPPPGAADLFPNSDEVPLNELVIRLQPKEAIYMKVNVKKPGLSTVPVQSELDLTYENRYPIAALEDAYTRLLLDVLRGKQATFVRNDELMAAWEVFTPLLHRIDKGEINPLPYAFGSRGPKEADALVESYGYVRNEAYHADWKSATVSGKKS